MRCTESLFVLATFFVFSNPVFAKRIAPRPLKPIAIDGVECSAPVEHMGFVEARDAKTGELIWSRQIYVVVKDPQLEGDVQDVFVSEIRPEGHALIIANERGSQYRLDLTSLEVTV